jgi:hypothetical protein
MLLLINGSNAIGNPFLKHLFKKGFLCAEYTICEGNRMRVNGNQKKGNDRAYNKLIM